jgi:hypothetical protein
VIISQNQYHNQYHAVPDIEVTLYKVAPTTTPFIVRVADGTAVHMSHDDAKLLHLQLTAALYEYEGE